VPELPDLEEPLPYLCFGLTLDSGVPCATTTTTRRWERSASRPRDRERRHQVLAMDQEALSAIGNACADEILFAARIHPKTFYSSLGEEERDRLYESIQSVLRWGIEEERAADRPVEVKAGDHGVTKPGKGGPGTIRADFSVETGRNLVHGSDSAETARAGALWFADRERATCSRDTDRWGVRIGPGVAGAGAA
jgi:hypothetical protein